MGLARVPLALALTAAVLVLAPHDARAQASRVRVVVSSPPSPVGAGARATAVGSAFIALADDATAASWNPGGLVQLERPELSVVGLGTLQIDRHGTMQSSDETDTRHVAPETDTTDALSLNFLSAALPFSWRGRNVVVSLNYQQVLSFERDFLIHLDVQPVGGELRRFVRDIEQQGSVYALSPALAVEILPTLSLGTALNYSFDGIGRSYAWITREHEVITRETSEGPVVSPPLLSQETYENFRGVNATIGSLWRPGPRLSVGAVVDLPFTARFTLERFGDLGEQTVSKREALQIDLPVSYGLGVSWRPADLLVLAADVTRVEWGDFTVQDDADRDFLVSGDQAGSGDVDAVTTIRVGVERLALFPAWILALRGGAFYDPEPGRGSPQDFYGVSAGLGATTPRWSLDVAYQLRFGLDVRRTAELPYLFNVDTGALDTYQHAFYCSLVYYL